jgi:hypothetical protein
MQTNACIENFVGDGPSLRFDEEVPGIADLTDPAFTGVHAPQEGEGKEDSGWQPTGHHGRSGSPTIFGAWLPLAGHR